MLRNCLQTAADRPSCDIEAIVLKVFTYFSVYTQRAELKSFVSLLMAVGRILKMYEAIK